jgi:molybdopterin synthase catalytic subunit
MTVRIRLFAVLRECVGRESIDLELDDGATVADAINSLQADGPLADALRGMPVLMAVNRDYAPPTRALLASDELALIPPVSGGAM